MIRFFIYRFFQGECRSSQVIISLGTKLDITLIIVSLKTDTCSFTSILISFEIPNQLLFLYDQGSPGRNATRFSDKEVDKKLLE